MVRGEQRNARAGDMAEAVGENTLGVMAVDSWPLLLLRGVHMAVTVVLVRAPCVAASVALSPLPAVLLLLLLLLLLR